MDRAGSHSLFRKKKSTAVNGERHFFGSCMNCVMNNAYDLSLQGKKVKVCCKDGKIPFNSV